MNETSGAILVGGRATRFDGCLKAALTIGGRTILERQVEALTRAGVRTVSVVGSWSLPAVAGVRHVPDVLNQRSGLGGLYSALLLATTPVVLVLASDMPFLHPALLSKLADIGDNADAVVPRLGGRWHPLCAAYRRTVAPLVKARLDRGSLRVTDAIQEMRVHELHAADLAPFDPDGILLMNLNTPGDYERARQLARDHA